MIVDGTWKWRHATKRFVESNENILKWNSPENVHVLFVYEWQHTRNRNVLQLQIKQAILLCAISFSQQDLFAFNSTAT